MDEQKQKELIEDKVAEPSDPKKEDVITRKTKGYKKGHRHNLCGKNRFC